MRLNISESVQFGQPSELLRSSFLSDVNEPEVCETIFNCMRANTKRMALLLFAYSNLSGVNFREVWKRQELVQATSLFWAMAHLQDDKIDSNNLAGTNVDFFGETHDDTFRQAYRAIILLLHRFYGDKNAVGVSRALHKVEDWYAFNNRYTDPSVDKFRKETIAGHVQYRTDEAEAIGAAIVGLLAGDDSEVQQYKASSQIARFVTFVQCYDDAKDIVEDFQNNSPNMFLAAASETDELPRFTPLFSGAQKPTYDAVVAQAPEAALLVSHFISQNNAKMIPRIRLFSTLTTPLFRYPQAFGRS